MRRSHTSTLDATGNGGIRLLSNEARSSVRAGQIVGSLGRTVEELVRNAALHGCATCIAVTIGAPSGGDAPFLEVSDDGHGMDPDDVRDLVGVEHCSSNGRGESLRALAALCVEMRVRTASRKRISRRSGNSKTTRSCGGTNAPRKRKRSEATRDKDLSEIQKEVIIACEKVILESNPVSFTCTSDGKVGRHPVLPLSLLQLASSSQFPPDGRSSRRSVRRDQSSHNNSIQAPTSTGTTITLSGLFHRHAVRRRHRERLLAASSSSAPEGGRAGVAAAEARPERADLAEVRSCLRSLALAHPLVSLELWNGRTGAAEARWPAPMPSDGNVRNGNRTAGRTLPRSGFNPSLPLSTSFSVQRGIGRRLEGEAGYGGSRIGPRESQRTLASALAERLRQLCGSGPANTESRYITVIYEEERSGCAVPSGRYVQDGGQTCSPHFNQRRQSSSKPTTVFPPSSALTSTTALQIPAWSIVGALSLFPNEDDDADDSGQTGGKRAFADARRVKQNEAVFINGIPARHEVPLSDLVQNVLGTYAARAGGNSFLAQFIIHITCPSWDCDLVVDEIRATMVIPNRGRLEAFLRKTIEIAMSDNGFACKKRGYSFGENNSKAVSRCSSQRKSKIKWSEKYAESVNDAGGNGPSRKAPAGVTLTTFSSRLVSSQQIGTYTPVRPSTGSGHHNDIVCKDEEIADEATKVESTTLERAEQLPTEKEGTSPFSDAFFDQPCPHSSVASLSAAQLPSVSFEDAFLDDGGTENTVSQASAAEQKSVDAKPEPPRPQDTAHNQLQWTRTRVRALESEISSLVADPSLSATTNSNISLSKAMLTNAQVIAQVDAKFIIINASGILCIVDQHAADERVSLERLERELLSRTVGATATNASSSDMIKALSLRPAQPLVLSPAQLTTISQHRNLLEKWRFSFQLPTDDSNDPLLLSGVPGIFDKVATAKDFLQFLQALGNRTSDAALVKPAFVKRVLASHACRYAIMFGDILPHGRCVKLIKDLSMCDLCFVCAHGRPSVVPLLNMNVQGNVGALAQQGQHEPSNELPLRFRKCHKLRKHRTPARKSEPAQQPDLFAANGSL